MKAELLYVYLKWEKKKSSYNVKFCQRNVFEMFHLYMVIYNEKYNAHTQI